MLFFLTGQIQSGKTRWLERLVETLADRGVECAGVIAPGIWRETPGVTPPASPYEKLGIENVLLPQGERIVFGMRRDLSVGTPGGQSTAAKLAWDITDEALGRVNAHFDELALHAHDADRTRETGLGGQPEPDSASGQTGLVEHSGHNQPSGQTGRPGLLIIDELGRLEMLRGEGLVSAMRMLDAGPTARYPHALVVVRDYLLEAAENRFAPAWGGARAILPDDAGAEAIAGALGI